MSTRVEQLAEEIPQHARGAGLSVVVAESCTAGRLATAFAKGEGAARRDGAVKTQQLRLGSRPADELVDHAREAALSRLRGFAFA
jgi:hypothetical protein